MLDTVLENCGTLGEALRLVGAAGIGISVGVWGLRKAWGYFRSMV